MANEETKLFDPERLGAFSDGFQVHPDLEGFYTEPADGEDVRIDEAKLTDAGYIAAYSAFEDCAPEDLQLRYAEGFLEPIGEWIPEPPGPDGWILVAKFDTELGPYAMFVRLKDGAA